MIYTGKFKTKNDETIEVNITTNDNSSEKIDLIFTNESPVIITQESSDGIFSPIKSRGCTITIVSKEEYFDLYSGESHGTMVEINNLSKGECLFYGYLTPCEYNQSFLYLNEIELEVVDALSTLKDFKYSPINNKNINKISDLLSYALIEIAGYKNVYIPYMGNKAWAQNNYNYDIPFPTNLEYLSDAMFKEKEDKYMDWYEIIEEVCKFFGLSVVPYGNSVYFIDYKLVKYCGDKEYNEQTYSQDFRTYYNLADYQPYYINDNLKVLNAEDYAGDDQNVEIDEVYNKISIKADIDELDDKDIFVSIEDDAENAALIVTKEDTMNTYEQMNSWIVKLLNPDPVIKSQYKVFSRLFYPTAKRINNKPISDYWQCYANTNVWEETMFAIPVIHAKFKNHCINYYDIDSSPLYNARLSRYEYQYCTLVQSYGWEVGTAPSAKVDWKTNIVFHTGIESWYRYYHDINTGEDGTDGNRRIRIIDKQTEYQGSNDIWSLWWNMYVNEMMCSPVLEFRGKDEAGFSPTSNNNVTYICITGDLLYQHSGNIGNDTVSVWYNNSNYKDYITTTFDDAGYNSANKTETLIGARNSGETDYNKGWPCLKCVLNIGDKWWDGNNWQGSYTEFWLYFHKENVNTGQEKLLMFDWNKIVVNHDYTSGINEDCYAIPVYNYDHVYGKINFKIFNPYVHLYGVTDTWDSYYMGKETIDGQDYIKFNIANCVPAVFMKDFDIKVVSVDDYINRSESWIGKVEKKDDDDDIIYSSQISSNNVVEFDELELKINTYNYKKPIAESYVFIYSGKGSYARDFGYEYLTDSGYSFKDNVNDRTNVEEKLLVEQYKEHYSSPKLIYNCEVHNYYEPWKCVTPKALNYLKMIVDEQEYDVKLDINKLKLIEY